MENRKSKIKLLEGIFNQSNNDGLKSLRRGNFPKVLIYELQGEGMLFSRRLNADIPAKYQDVVLDDKELNTLFVSFRNLKTFLLPDNGRT